MGTGGRATTNCQTVQARRENATRYSVGPAAAPGEASSCCTLSSGRSTVDGIASVSMDSSQLLRFQRHLEASEDWYGLCFSAHGSRRALGKVPMIFDVSARQSGAVAHEPRHGQAPRLHHVLYMRRAWTWKRNISGPANLVLRHGGKRSVGAAKQVFGRKSVALAEKGHSTLVDGTATTLHSR